MTIEKISMPSWALRRGRVATGRPASLVVMALICCVYSVGDSHQGSSDAGCTAPPRPALLDLVLRVLHVGEHDSLVDGFLGLAGQRAGADLGVGGLDDLARAALALLTAALPDRHDAVGVLGDRGTA